jgi:integrase
LTQKKEQQPSIAVFGIQGYSAAPAVAAGLADHPRAALGSSEQKISEQKASSFLPGPLHRELSSHQLRILLKAANLEGKQLIALLLTGLDIAEIVSLTPGQIDLDAGIITLNGKPPRAVPISRFLQSLFEQSEGQPLWDANDRGSRVDLSAALVCAAVDSGLPDADGITAEAIRHSYIAYLVRQGLRLSELEQVVGRLEPQIISSYRAYSPPQEGRHLHEIELLHPALINKT